jgi:8-oxo-dGTP diphosphatase
MTLLIESQMKKLNLPHPLHMVVGFLKDADENIPFIRKLKPEWQKGLLNGVGGKCKNGEAPWTAMVREWEEETGDKTEHEWRRFAVLRFPSAVLHCFRAQCKKLPLLPETNDAGEAIEVYQNEIKNGDCIPNLHWLLPLAFNDPDRMFVEAFADTEYKEELWS